MILVCSRLSNYDSNIKYRISNAQKSNIKMQEIHEKHDLMMKEKCQQQIDIIRTKEEKDFLYMVNY